MDTETMIRELESVEEKHKDDTVYTGQLNIAEMAHDVRKRLEDLKPYEDTGLTPAEIWELKERDTAKAPVKDTQSKIRYTDNFICPNCGRHFADIGLPKFCNECGQKIQWEG